MVLRNSRARRSISCLISLCGKEAFTPCIWISVMITLWGLRNVSLSQCFLIQISILLEQSACRFWTTKRTGSLLSALNKFCLAFRSSSRTSPTSKVLPNTIPAHYISIYFQKRNNRPEYERRVKEFSSSMKKKISEWMIIIKCQHILYSIPNLLLSLLNILNRYNKIMVIQNNSES